MGLETGNYLADLVPTNPLSGDKKSAGDDHIRLVKAVLQNTFPSANKAFYFPKVTSLAADHPVTAAEQNTIFFMNTTSSITATMPSLGVADAGWECSFVKVTGDTNPFFIAPNSGTIVSGEIGSLAKTRRAIPGRRTRVFWTGTSWFAERVVSSPVGSILEYAGASLPVGFEWPSGQTLNTSNYPDYVSIRGSGTTPDRRGRVGVAKDNLGGAAAGRIGNILNGTTLEAVAGEEIHTLTVGEIAQLAINISDIRQWSVPVSPPGGANDSGVTIAPGPSGVTARDQPVGISGTITASTNAGGNAHNNTQPSIVMNYLLVVE